MTRHEIAAVLSGESRWTIVHGDCLDVLGELPDASVHHVITDPPYGIRCTKTGAGARRGSKVPHNANLFSRKGGARIHGDEKPDGAWLRHAARVIKKNGSLYSFSRWDVDREWQTAIEDAGFKVANRIVWEKANFGSGDLTGSFGFSHETIFRASRGRLRLRCKRSGDVWRDAWTECIRHGKAHPFEKPIDLLERMVGADADPGEIILDPFAGSGTTGVAALRRGCRFIGIERDEKYAQLARDRIAAEVDGLTLNAARAGQMPLFGGAR